MPTGIYNRTVVRKWKLKDKRIVSPFTQTHKDRIALFRIGKKHNEETKNKISISHIGDKSYNWKGGITPENSKIRGSIAMRLWKNAVYAKDNFTCQKTGEKGGRLHAHHILNFAQYPELRFAIDNGITLSEKAHKEFHKQYGVKNNSREQLIEFLNNK